MSKEYFRISSELKNVIGQDLITDDFVAIFELVKNSFDAKASKVSVIFNLDDKNPSIHIVDDGKGMSIKDIRDKWLFLAYSAKKEGTEDEIGVRNRHYAGNKGVGRFSCDRLGQLLHLEAKTRSSAISVLDVDWRDFEHKAKNDFIRVAVNLEEKEFFSDIPDFGVIRQDHGVVLSILRLREPKSWTYEKLRNLKRALSKLLDPFDGDMTQRQIVIMAKAFLGRDEDEAEKAIRKGDVPFVVNGSVSNSLFSVLQNKTTSIVANITEGRLRVRLNDRGTFIYSSEENLGDEFSLLGNVSLDASIAYLNTAAKATFARRMGIASVSYGSLFLVKNGFRIYPIGEENNDFWGIDRRKQQGYNRYLGSREILGRISIESDDDSMFRESSSRDKGLIDTPALAQLRECAIYLVRKLEAFVVGISWEDKPDKNEETPARLQLDKNKAKIIQLIKKLSLNKTIRIIDFNRDLVAILDKRSEGFEESLESLRQIAVSQKDAILHKRVEQAIKRLEKAKSELAEVTRIAQAEQEARLRAETEAAKSRAQVRKSDESRKKTEKDLQEEQKRSIFLSASVGQDKEFLLGFLHQITICSNIARQNIEDTLIGVDNCELSEQDIRERLTDVLEWVEKIATLAKFSTKANFRYESRPHEEDLPMFVEQYIQNVAPAYESLITLSGQLDFHFRCSFNPLEMGIIFDNLITNSKKAHASKLTFESVECKDCNMLVITDDGDGLAEDVSRIFENGYTRTNGSGIGLYFCRKLMEKIGADIIVSPIQPKKGASFTLVFKK